MHIKLNSNQMSVIWMFGISSANWYVTIRNKKRFCGKIR
jgi:hypothetical protein